MADDAVKVNRFIAAVTEGIILLEALNFFSPRSFSFIDPAVGKGLTNPFLRLLNSSGRSVKMP
jgi:hypothetical protein